VAKGAAGEERLRHPQGAATGPSLRGADEAARREPRLARAEPGAEADRGADVLPRRARSRIRGARASAEGASSLRSAHGVSSVRVDRARAGGRRSACGSRHRSPHGCRRGREALRQDEPITPAVPLPSRAAEALDAHLPRLDTRVLFPGARGGPLALSPSRHRDWSPALRAAGLQHRSLYAMRHTYASMSIAAGMSLSSSPGSWERRRG
jgi:hypothetical protein